ncbi:hypothetical protein FACS1894177_01290 [Bacteroidia bacterium]|nr:hypothetical protein FACS1894177_01290 [Bacteroidia bacterium]
METNVKSKTVRSIRKLDLMYGPDQQLYYISGNGGLVAVYVKQSGQTDKTYYVCKDHLGSIVKLVDISGTEVFKASYDAWGNRTVANNTFAFRRGYTGHEHLAEFGLINMNGRVYDPVLGRFLSPDPFVQVPDFSQSYNRYSYCLNNPLRYTDPNGEFFFLIPYMGFSPNGGVEFGISAGIGIPNGLSAQISLGYGTANKDFTATVGVSYGGVSAYAGYNTQAGFIAGAGYGFGGSSAGNFNISTNTTSFGVNYSSSGGFGANFGGMQYSQYGGLSANPSVGVSYPFTTGAYGTYNITESDNKEWIGEPLTYNNETAEAFMKLNNLKRDGFDNLYANGTLASDNYSNADGSVYYTDSEGGKRKTWGAARLRGKKYIFWGKQQIDMYLYKNAFRSPETLYLTIGHELVHVGLYNLGITNNLHNHEVTAYSWSVLQAATWGLPTFLETYTAMMNFHIGKGGKPYPYNTMVPISPTRPIKP